MSVVEHDAKNRTAQNTRLMHRRDLADQNSKYIPFLEGDLLVEIHDRSARQGLFHDDVAEEVSPMALQLREE